MPDNGKFETLSSSIPLSAGYYWYWKPSINDFVVAEAVEHKGKMKLKIDNCLQAFIDDGGYIHSQLLKPTNKNS